MYTIGSPNQYISSLEQAFQPADKGHYTVNPMGPPSFQRWSKHSERKHHPELMHYIGSMLLSLEVVVQNRRKSDVALVTASETSLTVAGLLKNELIPQEQRKVTFSTAVNGFVSILS